MVLPSPTGPRGLTIVATSISARSSGLSLLNLVALCTLASPSMTFLHCTGPAHTVTLKRPSLALRHSPSIFTFTGSRTVETVRCKRSGCIRGRETPNATVCVADDLPCAGRLQGMRTKRNGTIHFAVSFVIACSLIRKRQCHNAGLQRQVVDFRTRFKCIINCLTDIAAPADSGYNIDRSHGLRNIDGPIARAFAA